jgi:hypothetical protein
VEFASSSIATGGPYAKRRTGTGASESLFSGATEGFRIAEELRMQALLSDPSWPRAGQRREDLDAQAVIAYGVPRLSADVDRHAADDA